MFFLLESVTCARHTKYLPEDPGIFLGAGRAFGAEIEVGLSGSGAFRKHPLSLEAAKATWLAFRPLSDMLLSQDFQHLRFHNLHYASQQTHFSHL